MALQYATQRALLASTAAFVPISAPFAKVNGPLDGPTAGPYESWSADYSGTPSVPSPVAFTLARQGYTTGASTTTYNDTAYVTSRVRQVYPNGAGAPTANTTSLSEWVYSTDSLFGGAVNNSTLVSPKPTCQWGLPHRGTVGNSLPLEVTVFHPNARNGQQVAAVVFRATDGTNTVTATVGTCTKSTQTTDKNAVYVYATTLDITSLNDNALITVNANVYPWIGAAASVMDSSTNSALKDFSPRYYRKDTAKAAAPPIIYVATAGASPPGNDTSAVVSTNDVTARANPALTIAGAFNKLQAAGAVDGAQIRLQAGTFALGGPTVGQMVQNIGALTITRDPNVVRANAILTWGNGETPRLTSTLTAPITTGCLRITDLTCNRVANLTISGGFGGSGARLEIQWVDVTMDLGGFAAGYLNISDDYFYGATVTNAGTGMWAASSSGQHRIFRGVTASYTGNLETITLLGNTLTLNGGTLAVTSGGTAEGQIVAYNQLLGITNTSFYTIATAVTNGCAIVQNVFEYCSVTTGLSLGVSNDGLTNNTVGVIIHSNTFAGFWSNGRVNLFYDDGATARTNKQMSVKGNILVSHNIKGDTFMTSGTRIGNFGPTYGCGYAGNLFQYLDANSGGGGPPASFAQAYFGISSTNPVSAATPNMADGQYTLYRATTSGPTVGAGGGTYTGTLTQAKSLNPVALSPGDLAGTARPLVSDTAGAYVAP